MTSGPIRLTALALFIAGALASARLGHAAEVELYRPQHRPAVELAPLAAAILGAEGSATADPGSGLLLLLGTRAGLDAAIRALRSLDVAPRSFSIESLSVSQLELEHLGLSVDGWLSSGSLRVGRVRGPDDELRLRIGVGSGTTTSGSRMAIRVLEGRVAELWTGTSYPVQVQVFRERGEDTRVFATPELTSIRTGFRVRPRGLSEGRIELAIEAVRSHSSASGNPIKVAASMLLVVEPGEWVAIAGSGSESIRSRDALSAVHRVNTAAADLVLVRTRPIEPGP